MPNGGPYRYSFDGLIAKLEAMDADAAAKEATEDVETGAEAVAAPVKVAEE